MGKTLGEQMREFYAIPVEKIGPYIAKSGDITATLRGTAILNFVAVSDSGYDIYDINVRFSIPSNTQRVESPTSLDYHFADGGDFNDVIQRLKLNEEHIEELLSVEGESWQGTRNVMTCILSLEEKTKDIQPRRTKAMEKRQACLDKYRT